ncbi:clostripain family protease [Marinitoga piezophila KA3]|uniref:Clostripain family protease n=1 Tax=Marinitoga piezophila (strain DSM 14283 / JCM 11233 / KA3) TaxID=443254 RepID=H2J3E6_MARPK|nr:clostripain family protease [Marinitoga piezophila KA3]
MPPFNRLEVLILKYKPQITNILIYILLLLTLNSCVFFQKDSPLTEKEYIAGYPLSLTFTRKIEKIYIYDSNGKLIYKYEGNPILSLKLPYIVNSNIKVEFYESESNRHYINNINVIKPKIVFLLYGGADNNLDYIGNSEDYKDPLTNNLDYFFNYDINEIRNSIKKSTTPIVTIILADRQNIDDYFLFITNFNGYKELKFSTENFGYEKELSSASEDTLYKFINDFTIKDSNIIKILDIWDHGNGWKDESKTLKNEAIKPKLIVDDNGSYLKIKNIQNVLKKYKNTYNQKINMLLFDACNMMSLEIMYEFRDLTDYFVGSVYSIAAFGFYYNFFHDLDLNNLEYSLLYNLIENYRYYYSSIYPLKYISLSAVNLNEFKNIWDKLEYTNNISDTQFLYKNSDSAYVSEPTDMIDIIKLKIDNETLSNYINNAIINSIVKINGNILNNYSGIGMMFEDIFNKSLYDDYKALDFYTNYKNWIETTWKAIILENAD